MFWSARNILISVTFLFGNLDFLLLLHMYLLSPWICVVGIAFTRVQKYIHSNGYLDRQWEGGREGFTYFWAEDVFIYALGSTSRLICNKNIKIFIRYIGNFSQNLHEEFLWQIGILKEKHPLLKVLDALPYLCGSGSANDTTPYLWHLISLLCVNFWTRLMYILVAKSRKNEAKWRPHFNDFKNTDTRGSKGGEDHRVTRSVILDRF